MSKNLYLYNIYFVGFITCYSRRVITICPFAGDFVISVTEAQTSSLQYNYIIYTTILVNDSQL